MSKEITIIGAGIGGLTTAIVLQQKGCTIHIYESADQLQPVGAGILIANNAMQVYQQLGIQKSIEEAGNLISRMRVTDNHLRNISDVDLTPFEKKFGVTNVAIHRGTLQQLLVEKAGAAQIHLGKRVEHIEQKEAYQLHFTDQSSTTCASLIGADGIHSVVRDQLIETGRLRDAGQICWRGICEMVLPDNWRHALLEAWGRGKRFGFVQINARQVYWYALIKAKNYLDHEINLETYFSDFHPDLRHILSATKKEQIFRTDIMDLEPLVSWHKGSVCLLGDAAHATTPNMGQGACQAIEDAYVLGKLIDRGLSMPEIFSAYEKIRKPKALKIVQTSWALGQMAHWENPLACWFRNLLFTITPKSINNKQIEQVFNLDKC